MADSVHAPKLTQEGSLAQALPYLLRGHPLTQQGFPSHDSVGATGDFGDQSIDAPTLLLHSNT
jgi:hypothetical protein